MKIPKSGCVYRANSIAESLHSTFHTNNTIVGIVLTALALIIIVGGIKTISKVSSVVVPCMAIFYVIAGLIVILLNIKNLPAGLYMIFKMAFSVQAVGGGLCGSITAAIMNSMRYGIARGVFSNEAGMGSAAITAAAATTDNPVRQGYINMTGTFWDTIVVCTITGLCIATSGVLGMTEATSAGSYTMTDQQIAISATTLSDEADASVDYDYVLDGDTLTLTDGQEQTLSLTFEKDSDCATDIFTNTNGCWHDETGNAYLFQADGNYEYQELVKGAALTIAAFESGLGKIGAILVSIGIALFAFSTILGWEYHGEKAFEYIFNTHKLNMVYRIVFSLVVFVGATTALDIVWSFSDIANALMAIPNLICLLALSGVIAKDVEEFQPEIDKQKKK